MNRLLDLINIVKCNIFVNFVSFDNCFSKFLILILFGFIIIIVWVLVKIIVL